MRLPFLKRNREPLPDGTPAAAIHRNRGDLRIWWLYIALAITSLIEVYSAASAEVYRSTFILVPLLKQGAILALGIFVAWLIVRYVTPRHIVNATIPIIVLAFILSWAPVVLPWFGLEELAKPKNNAARWITIPGLPDYQVSEMTKIGIVFLGAYLLPKGNVNRDLKHRYITLWVVSALMIFPILKENGSTGVMLFATVFVMSFFQLGFRSKYILRTALIACAALVFIIGIFALLPAEAQQSVFPRGSTWINRFKSSNPADDATLTAARIDSLKYAVTDKNAQQQYSKMAIARGILPQGSGNSKMRDMLPVAHADFIYPIIVEELGIFGLLWIPFLYLFLFFRVSTLAIKTKNAFFSMIMLGLIFVYTLQAMVNITISTGVFGDFVTGQSLPLIGKGGSSILTMGVSFGIILVITRFMQDQRDINRRQAQAALAGESEAPTPEAQPVQEAETTRVPEDDTPCCPPPQISTGTQSA